MGNGLERLPCDQTAPCPLRDSGRGCFEDIHHHYHPEATYKALGAAAMVFRELPENKDQRCRNLHNIEHEVTDPPPVPGRADMVRAIARAVAAEQVQLSKTKMRKIFGKRPGRS